jgi:cyclopropane-fatty-acyl-phospholipid synthase
MSMRLLSGLLTRFVEKGSLTIYDTDGKNWRFGKADGGTPVAFRLMDKKVARQIFFNPELAFPEAYMDGRIEFENGSTIYDLLVLFSNNRKALGSHPVQQILRRIWRRLKRWQQHNPLAKAEQNVRHHYDIKPDFYELWLDSTMNYSCAYFTDPANTLEQAQTDKMRHIAAKLQLKPGMSVLDIGCGWGALSCYMAANFGVNVTGITLSPEQATRARERAIAMNVADKVTIIERDYRQMEGKFDRVVSIGMMEHVGISHFDEYFKSVKQLISQGGYGLIHAIGRMSSPGTTAPFIRKYIFPGGYAPSLSEVFASTERVGLCVSDCEILRLHYYWTLKAWRTNFTKIRTQAVEMFDERFARMWEFYLMSAELGFLTGSNMVYQILVSEKRDDVPVTRDFMLDDERALMMG